MATKPFITNQARPAETGHIGDVISKTYLNQPGQVSFGTIDYSPGWFISLHHHDLWELIIIDGSSAGPGFVMFDGRWWRAAPGSAAKGRP